MAAHRYWRLSTATVNGGGATSIGEITGATVAGGANVFTGGTATASSVYSSPTYDAIKAFDGSAATFWAGSTVISWIYYDLGAGNDKDIVEFSFSARPDGFCSSQTPVTGTLDYSDDAVTWTVAFSFTGVTAATVSQVQFFPGPDLTGKVYFDDNNKTSTMSITNSIKTQATSSGAGSIAVTRPFTGKHYGSAVITTLTGTPVIGLVNGQYSMSGGALLGITNDSLGYRSGGTVVLNNVTIATLTSFVAGDRIDWAVNPQDRLIWFRKNNGNWNNNAAYDPVTNTGGIDFSTMNLGRLLIAVGASASGTVWTGQFDPAFTNAAPTDYAKLATVQYTKINATLNYGLPTGVSLLLGPAVRCGSMPSGDRIAKAFTPAGTITVVSGLVKENGVIVAGRVVEAYDRNTGDLLGRTVSAIDGSWSIPALGRPAVRVVGSDPTTYNSLVYDNVIPV